MHTEIFKLFHCFDFSTRYIKAFPCENHKKHKKFAVWGNADFRYAYHSFCRELLSGFKKLMGDLIIWWNILWVC